MLLGKVIGTLTPAVTSPGLEGIPMLLVQPLNKKLKEEGKVIVVFDSTRMAAPQELIYYEGGKEAAFALEDSFVPVDYTIIGIVDDVNYLDME